MSDWNDFDNLPTDDDDDDDIFDWFGDDGDDDSVVSEAADDDSGLDWDAAAEDVGLDWMDDEDDKVDDFAPIAGQARPSSLNEEFMEQNLEAAEEAAYADTGELLDWMSNDEASEEETPEPASGLPSWLEGMDIDDPDTDEVDSIQEDFDVLFGAGQSDAVAEPASDDEFDDFESLFGAADDDEEESVGFASVMSGLSDDDDRSDDFLNSLTGVGGDDDDDMSWFEGALDTEEPTADFDSFITSSGGDDDDDDDMSWFEGALDTDQATGDFDAVVSAEANEAPSTSSAGLDWFNDDTDDDDEMSEFIEKMATGQLNPDVVDALDDDSDDDMDDDMSQFIEKVATGQLNPDLVNDYEDDDIASSFDWGLEETGDDEFIEEDKPITSEIAWDFEQDDQLADTDPQPTSEASQPDWLTDFETPNDEDTLDRAIGKMFTDTLGDDADMELAPDAQISADAPDWLDAVETPDDDLDFLLDAVGDSGTDEDLDDLLSELDTDTEADLDDLLAELGGDVDEELDLDALLADVDTDGDADLDDIMGLLDDEPVAEAADDLSFLDDFDAEPVAEAADGFDFLDDIPDIEDEPVAEAADDLSFLDDIPDIEDEPVAEAVDDLSFLDNIPDIEDEPVAEPAADLNFLDQLDDFDFSEAEEVPEVGMSASDAAIDIDTLLASFEGQDVDSVPIEQADLSAVFAQMDLDEQQEEELRQKLDSGDGEIPDWLREAAAGSATGGTAAALLRQRQDRSLEDLDDRLLDLRERGLSLPADADASTGAKQLDGVLASVTDALAPATLAATSSALISDVVLTDDQQRRAGILSGLIGADEDASERQTQRGLVRNIRPGRIIISVILLVLVVVPFFLDDLGLGGFGFGELPPREFDDLQKSVAFLRMQLQDENSTVLIATEYGAASARELDTMTEAILSHTLNRGAKAVVVSSDPVGLLRADNILVELTDDVGRNQDWYVAGYLPAGNLGLRELVTSTNQVLRTDISGDATNLNIRSLDDFSMIVIISDSGDSVRRWMEQVNPNTSTEFIIGASQSAVPLAQPYAELPEVIALLEGYPDAVTYNYLSVAENNPSPTPTFTPSITPTPTNTPTATLTPSITPTPLVSDTPTPTPTATPAPIEVAVIVGTGRANVRSAPTSGGAIVGGVNPGDVVRVLGLSNDEDWINIELLDGTQGWIADFLGEIDTRLETELSDDSVDEEDASAPRRRVFLGDLPDIRQTGDGDMPSVDVTDKRVLPQELTDVDERWTAYSLGITGAIVIIALGNLFWIIRAIVRRRR